MTTDDYIIYKTMNISQTRCTTAFAAHPKGNSFYCYLNDILSGADLIFRE